MIPKISFKKNMFYLMKKILVKKVIRIRNFDSTQGLLEIFILFILFFLFQILSSIYLN
jgi:hypothetical protein